MVADEKNKIFLQGKTKVQMGNIPFQA
jgi:hypothetical protein